MDRWLAGQRLDSFGLPKGTAYAGGSPLIDETSGKTTTRLDFVYTKHPEAKRACQPDAAKGR